MKSAPLIGIFLGFLTTSFAHDDIARAQVEKASADFVRAVESGNVQILETLQSPALVYTAANNRRMTREEVFTALRADFGKWSLHNTVIEACQIFGDTAITTGTEEVRSKAGGSSLRRYTNVWQRSGNTWVMISRTVSVVRNDTLKKPDK